MFSTTSKYSTIHAIECWNVENTTAIKFPKTAMRYWADKKDTKCWTISLGQATSLENMDTWRFWPGSLLCLKMGPDPKHHPFMFSRDAAWLIEILQHFVFFLETSICSFWFLDNRQIVCFSDVAQEINIGRRKVLCFTSKCWCEIFYFLMRERMDVGLGIYLNNNTAFFNCYTGCVNIET